MKKILIIICFLPLLSQAQNLGETQDEILEKFDIGMYRMSGDYYELVDTTTNTLTVYLLGLNSQEVYGIEYIYKEEDLYNLKLQELTKEAVKIGFKTWLKDEDIVINSFACNGVYNIFIRDISMFIESINEVELKDTLK